MPQKRKITINISKKNDTGDKLSAILNEFQTQKPLEPLEHKEEEKKERVKYEPVFSQKTEKIDCDIVWKCSIIPIMVVIILIVFFTAARG